MGLQSFKIVQAEFRASSSESGAEDLRLWIFCGVLCTGHRDQRRPSQLHQVNMASSSPRCKAVRIKNHPRLRCYSSFGYNSFNSCVRKECKQKSSDRFWLWAGIVYQPRRLRHVLRPSLRPSLCQRGSPRSQINHALSGSLEHKSIFLHETKSSHLCNAETWGPSEHPAESPRSQNCLMFHTLSESLGFRV